MVPPGLVSRHRAILMIRATGGMCLPTHARRCVRDERPMGERALPVYARLKALNTRVIRVAPVFLRHTLGWC